MATKVGTRLRSAVCDTEVVVIRSPDADVDLRCGGQPMIPVDATRQPDVEPLPAFSDGSTLGKRYAEDDLGVEVLVTKAGAGSLSIGANLLPVKDPKRLPSSD